MSSSTDPIVARLRAVDSCAVSDALDALGLEGGVGGLRAMWPCGRLAGRVRTVETRPPFPGEPVTGIHAASTIASARPDDVVVVDHDARTDAAGWGGLLALAASVQQVAGVVVYGACRDLDETEALGLPIFALGANPRSARGRVFEASAGEPIELDGVVVREGDYVIADATGVVFVPAAQAEEVTRRAEEIVERERTLAADLRGGRPVAEVLDARYRPPEPT